MPQEQKNVIAEGLSYLVYCRTFLANAKFFTSFEGNGKMKKELANHLVCLLFYGIQLV